jgi:hypothetical protein
MAIDKYQISQGKFFFEKPGISPNCGFFQHFLAPFDTFTTRYDQLDIKFEFPGYFYSYKHFIQKSFLKIIQKCPSDLCGLVAKNQNWRGNFKLICNVTSLLPCKDSRWTSAAFKKAW